MSFWKNVWGIFSVFFVSSSIPEVVVHCASFPTRSDSMCNRWKIHLAMQISVTDLSHCHHTKNPQSAELQLQAIQPENSLRAIIVRKFPGLWNSKVEIVIEMCANLVSRAWQSKIACTQCCFDILLWTFSKILNHCCSHCHFPKEKNSNCQEVCAKDNVRRHFSAFAFALVFAAFVKFCLQMQWWWIENHWWRQLEPLKDRWCHAMVMKGVRDCECSCANFCGLGPGESADILCQTGSKVRSLNKVKDGSRSTGMKLWRTSTVARSTPSDRAVSVEIPPLILDPYINKCGLGIFRLWPKVPCSFAEIDTPSQDLVCANLLRTSPNVIVLFVFGGDSYSGEREGKWSYLEPHDIKPSFVCYNNNNNNIIVLVPFLHHPSWRFEEDLPVPTR